ncbi:beta family protein [Mesorhizobium sp. AR07]|uniref:beta family protein n=1 Tax=Mesorhizobium sp. AR07 TaxID=2865838 RepID=UPI00216039CF|nr:beta family protein [Mesorhizobium sp. AR07]UVK46742.1 beta family protein [Mesorhizobium sp. AR07]
MVLEGIEYVPTLAVRASEMTGLEFLPGATKDRMTPCFLLAPWANSKSLSRTITRIERAFPHRPYFLDLDRDYEITNDQSVAQQEYSALLDPSDACANWVGFVAQHEQIMPCIQAVGLSEAEIRRQMLAVRGLGRSYCFRIMIDPLPINLDQIIGAINAEGTADFAIILEGGWTNDALSLAARFTGLIRNALAEINPVVPVVCSCTSIPRIFTDFNDDAPALVPFTNRTLVEQIARNSNRERVIYGDWGSTRPREPSGFANRPLDRIDYPTDSAWYIARNKDDEWDFRDAALAVVNGAEWDGNLGIWGEEMIRNTTVNAELGVDTPQKNVAARVNIHLHRQAFFGQPRIDPQSLDEDWQD